MNHQPRLFGALVTFRRQTCLKDTLDRLLRQQQRLEGLYVIDNEGSSATEQIVAEAISRHSDPPVQYIDAQDNLGPAGGWALAMQEIGGIASPNDWVVVLDDNNPPETDSELQQVFSLAVESRQKDPSVGGVGITGAWFDWRSGRIQRVPDDRLYGAVDVDYLAGGFLSMYSLAAIQDAGPFRTNLFFGSVELEFGLRLRRAGCRLLAHGDVWRERRRRYQREQLRLSPSLMCSIHWQRYYRIRNYIAMMNSFGRWDLAVRWAAIQCLVKPACTSFRSPRTGYQGFRQAIRATLDAFRGRMGRTVEPPPGAPQRDYVLARSDDATEHPLVTGGQR